MTPLQAAFRFIYYVTSMSDTDLSKKTHLIRSFMLKFREMIDFDIAHETDLFIDASDIDKVALANETIEFLKTNAAKLLLTETIELAVSISTLDGAIRNDEYDMLEKAATQWDLDIDEIIARNDPQG